MFRAIPAMIDSVVQDASPEWKAVYRYLLESLNLSTDTDHTVSVGNDPLLNEVRPNLRNVRLGLK